LPETNDLRLKSLYNWLNRLRDHAQSITPQRGAGGMKMTRTPAGVIHQAPPPPPRGEAGIRSVTNWYLPPVTITRKTAEGVTLGAFTWHGLIGFGPHATGPAANENNEEGQGGFGSDTLFGLDYGWGLGWTTNDITYRVDPLVCAGSGAAFSFSQDLAFYLIDLPPTIRNQILGSTYTQTDQTASGFDERTFNYAYPGGNDGGYTHFPFDTLSTEVANGPAATDDYAAYIDPSYFPGATLYIGKPNRWASADRFFYYDEFFGANIELNPGWVDLNVDARRWTPAGLVENHMRVTVGLAGGGWLVPAGTAGSTEITIPVNQDSNYVPTG
jgi:hypothetical protein